MKHRHEVQKTVSYGEDLKYRYYDEECSCGASRSITIEIATGEPAIRFGTPRWEFPSEFPSAAGEWKDQFGQ